MDAVPIKIPDWPGMVSERNRLVAELDAARATLAEQAAEIEQLHERVDGLEADRAPGVRAAARNTSHAWVRAQYDGNDEQITDRLRGCLNRLVDAIQRHDKKRGEVFATLDAAPTRKDDR